MSHMNTSIEKQTLSPAPRSGARILEHKSALVFGAGGSIGAAVAKEFASGRCASLLGRPNEGQFGTGCPADHSGRRRSAYDRGRCLG